MSQLFRGAASREDTRNSSVMKFPAIWKLPFCTPIHIQNKLYLSCCPLQSQCRQPSKSAPLKRISAACSAVNPSSPSSIFFVSCGFVLVSSSYPFVNIVGGKNICTSISYSKNSCLNMSANPLNACLPGKYDAYPGTVISPRVEETKVMWPVRRCETMSFETACAV